MSRRSAPRLFSNDKWRHAEYVTQLHNLYVRDSNVTLARDTSGPCATQNFRQTLEFYTRLCGKVIQHLEKQVRSPPFHPPESARWSYNGLFFTVMYNLNYTHHKDLIALLVALAKLLRGEHYGLYKLDPLRYSVESFLACLFTCSDRMIERVHTIANGPDPAMNKWKIFAALLRDIPNDHVYPAYDVLDNKAYPKNDEGCGRITSEAALVFDDHVADRQKCMDVTRPSGADVGSDTSAGCLASDLSETLFAKIINRATLRKDFARLAFVLYWLSRVGFSRKQTAAFFSMMLVRMLELEEGNPTEPLPRDIISVLSYALHFDIEENLKKQLCRDLSIHNRNSLLHLNMHDTSSLLDCLLNTDEIDQGLVVALFTNLQLLLIQESVPLLGHVSNLAHCYLTERSRTVADESPKWVEMFLDFDELNDLSDKFIGKGSLLRFLQNVSVLPSSRAVDPLAVCPRYISDITVKLQRLSLELDDLRPYCVKLIEHMSKMRGMVSTNSER
ncbi:uncharacterized protein BXIN_0189 [Babesia sp. Xinjiang]|uniref:uncharacterized protein n=1 Tax=Babesia sp. Xinjiang TaxID=462227 RepID=UPI000A225FF3|nr:uncharacterized protein BXIN_0189 [Babesia sp. Xinjiang]ORM39861.1 hypothetical protein BXIN_0189 [Babesia sp. Xinjiang]